MALRTLGSRLLLWLGVFACTATATERVVVHPEDHGEALVNPMMGWTFHFYSNIPANYGSKLAPSDLLEEFPGLSTIYLRIPWSYLEPEEEVFTWSMVDAPAQRWIDQGLQVAFRISCSESWMRYATPQWVEEAGAKGFDFTWGKGAIEGGQHWEPDYNDPVFLEKLDRFLEVMAERYDGNPRVAFIDVGSFGVWGEGHTFASTQIKYSSETVIRHIDLYRKHFKKTLLAANDDFSFQGEETIEYARDQGLTLRDDSILVQPPPKQYFHAGQAEMFWPRLPVILENEHYGGSRDRGNWGDGSLLLQAVEDYHASYASIHWWPREFLEEQRDLIERINRRLGYRLNLNEISWPAEVPIDASMTVAMEWSNAGVAPCYPGGHPTLTLKDDQGGIVAVFVDSNSQVRDLEVGPPNGSPSTESNWTVRFAQNLKPGDYRLFVSVGALDGTPQIALPYENADGHRRYELGRVHILPKSQ
ncbi:MAG: DUF4832 domain-containing protein [Candidatus Omnitrophica bacterium]|nr:DUF4832 domain-containing protein [Candidatus Omnitrophota bacterium]